MMKKIILFFLSLISLCSANAQTEFPPAYSITTNTSDGYVYLPDSCFQMMADPSGKMTLQDVISSGNFQDTDRKINYHIKTYWLRYQLVNRMDKVAEIYPSFNQEALYINLYVKSDSSSWQHLKSGTLTPWRERDGLKSLISVHLSIPAGKTVMIYQKITFDYTISSPQNAMVYFNSPLGINLRQQAHYSQSLRSVFLLGIILLAVIINLYFYFIVREKEFLYFSLFLFLLGLGFIAGVSSASGFLGDVFFKNQPYVQFYLDNLEGTFYWFVFIYFIRYAFKTKRDFPRWDKYLIALSFVTIIFSVVFEFGSIILHKNLLALFVQIWEGLSLILGFSLLFTLVLYVRNKDKIIRIMVYALAPFAFLLILHALLSIPANISWLYSSPSHNATNFMKIIWWLLDKVRLLNSISLVWMIVLFACVLFMRFSMLRRRFAQEKLERERERRTVIEQQKTELEKQVAERTSELQQSLENLKSTQSQLIQSEKMASLGELTAGIAHEIQNPLNFVNNFSDVNKELLDEMKSEILSDNKEEAISIANDVIENEEKINHHGKRADAIVKGMLQHSRTSSGQKEPTDINALCDEYLRLSYHGLRAKDKSFNADFKTDFDESVGKINIVPQDIGRVLLNLFNNAFYAVNEQKSKNFILYEPIVSVTTKKSDNHVIITVSDNGNGIPQNIVDKIFQPFFTTKPTGSSTGLGLSLSYDIVKAHGGEIKVETKEGEGTEFIVLLNI